MLPQPLSISATSNDYLTIACDSYTKKEVRDEIANLVGSAPEVLNTLQEMVFKKSYKFILDNKIIFIL